MSATENYREVILSVFKYINMMRSSDFPAWYQQEISKLQAIRFRFQEKRSPDDYATWISEHMAWPVPRDQILSGPKLVEEWNEDGEKEMRNILNTLTIETSRVLLMAKKEEYQRIQGPVDWKNEPIYGTPYHVERFDSQFVKEVCVSSGKLTADIDWRSRRRNQTIFLLCICPVPMSSFLRT